MKKIFQIVIASAITLLSFYGIAAAVSGCSFPASYTSWTSGLTVGTCWYNTVEQMLGTGSTSTPLGSQIASKVNATGTIGVIPIFTATTTLGSSSLSQAGGITFINGIPVFDAGGDMLNNVIQSTAGSVIVQTNGGSAAVGNFAQSVNYPPYVINTSTVDLTLASGSTKFCNAGGLIIVTSTATSTITGNITLTYPSKAQIASSTCAPTTSAFSDQFVKNDTLFSLTEVASSGDVFFYTGGTTNVIPPGGYQRQTGQMLGSSLASSSVFAFTFAGAYPTASPTGTLISANSTGGLQTTTYGGQGLTFSGNTLTWTNPGFISTSTGLTVSNFASPNISQWTNNVGYVTSTTGLTLGGTPTVSSCGGGAASSVTFSYTGTVASFTVPTTGSGTIAITVGGANGGGGNGVGGQQKGTLSVNAGQVLYYYVGGKGSQSTSTNGSAGTCIGGAGGGSPLGGGNGFQGGQCSWISGSSTFTTSTVFLVAGGGGGNATGTNGGSASSPIGVAGSNGSGNNGGGGGTQSAGGAGVGLGSAGSAAIGGAGGTDSVQTGGGGGGGGFFGGGGGGQANGTPGPGAAGGGGGGSNFASSSLASISTSTNNGTGTILLSYSLPVSITGRDSSGFVAPTNPVNACTITYSAPHTTFSSCVLTMQNASNSLWVTNQSSTGFTINASNTLTISTPVNYNCFGD